MYDQKYIQKLNIPQSYISQIDKAIEFATKAHEGVMRYSGEPYISHPLAVALILSSFDVHPNVIIAGILHDTVTDGSATHKQIEIEFGKDIDSMVLGVERLGSIKYQGSERHAESLRKFFVVISNDIRIMLIKLAERLHNMRTLEHVPKEKQKRIAFETLKIYAPLANRMGMGELKGELEDLAFKFTDPINYSSILKIRESRVKAVETHIKKVQRSLQRLLALSDVKVIRTDSRIKHLWSLHNKLNKIPNKEIEKVFDIIALRIITNSVDDCYKVLGLIHAKWKAVPGRLKDYIAIPKLNGYQSLHTAIFVGDGTVAEIQIRTKEMHEAAELGVASHLIYDESGKPKNGAKQTAKLGWAGELLKKSHDGSIDSIKEFFEAKIFVFTPKGEVVELPDGSTPIDFAYAIHSSIGNHASGVLINGKMSTLNHKLQSNDIVEILINKKGSPHEKWLSFVKTSEAKRKIKNALKPPNSIK